MFFSLGGIFFLIVSSCSSSVSSNCFSDLECPAGQICDQTSKKCIKGCVESSQCQKGATCENGRCVSSSNQEEKAFCGDGRCSPIFEDCISCQKDCQCSKGNLCNAEGKCVNSVSCGNEICEPERGENCISCPSDCGCYRKFVCSRKQKKCIEYDTDKCGDGKCDPEEDCTICYRDCCRDGQSCDLYSGICKDDVNCGNDICEKNENCSTCPNDCKCPDGKICRVGACVDKDTCNNGICESDIGENCVTCPNDCKCPSNMKCNPLSQQCESISCTTDADCPSGHSCQNGSCSPKQASCTTDADCPSGHSCQNGSCSPKQKSECTKKGVTKCEGKKLYICSGGKWTLKIVCKYDCIKRGNGHECAACSDGEKKCSSDGKKVLTCRGGSWSAQACPTGENCVYSSGGVSCKKPSSSSSCNIKGELSCKGNNLYICDGKNLNFYKSCRYGCVKSGSSYGCADCNSGEKKCSSDGKKVLTCKGGKWSAQSCPAGENCVYGSSGVYCKKPSSSSSCNIKGELSCKGNSIYICDGKNLNFYKSCTYGCVRDSQNKVICAQCKSDSCKSRWVRISCKNGIATEINCTKYGPDFACFNGSCRKCECSKSGDRICSGSELRKCNGCNYVLEQTCKYGCDSSKKACKSSPQCSKTYCKSKWTLLQCNNGRATEINCTKYGPDYVCSNNSCRKCECSTKGYKLCFGKDLRECDGCRYVKIRTCPNGCKFNQCCQCTGTGYLCSGNVLYKCDGCKKKYVKICSNGCSGNRCCQCKGTGYVCDGNRLYKCDGCNKKYVATCAIRCKDGRCCQCTGTDYLCGGNVLYKCDGCRKNYVKTCPNGCQGGKCCACQGTNRYCEGDRLYRCNGCFKTYLTRCTYGCKGGGCCQCKGSGVICRYGDVYKCDGCRYVKQTNCRYGCFAGRCCSRFRPCPN